MSIYMYLLYILCIKRKILLVKICHVSSIKSVNVETEYDIKCTLYRIIIGNKHYRQVPETVSDNSDVIKLLQSQMLIAKE